MSRSSPQNIPPPVNNTNSTQQSQLDIQGMQTIHLKAGDYHITNQNQIITTVLGACLSACVRDRELGIGGMNHFILPYFAVNENSDWEYTAVNSAIRFGTHNMEQLINSILKQGGKRNNLEFKFFGAGNVIGPPNNIGEHNIKFIRDFMNTEGYGISAESLGNEYPIKINYHPVSGKAWVKRVEIATLEVAAQEKLYIHQLEEKIMDGTIEIF